MSAAQVIDWSKVEPHYRAGLRSLPDLAKEFKVSHTAIAKHAKKNGWDRDLKARVKARADAKVSEAMVAAAGFKSANPATDAVRVEVEAEVQARIRLTHRTDITKYREMCVHLKSELDLLGDEEKLPIRVRVFRDLTDTLKTLVAMECQAYGLEGAPPPPPPGEQADPTDIARRLAFVLAAGMHSQPRMTQ